MNKTVVIDIAGLSTSVIGVNTPFLEKYIACNHLTNIDPLLPAVTTSVQSTYLTGKYPVDNGIIGNGWYDRIDCEIKFWRQSNKLVIGEKIWDKAKAKDPSFTSSTIFWWYNMYSTSDYSVTPRPNYLADGRKMPDCYSNPPELRDMLQDKLGKFPLFEFWGPGANINSSKWIADASRMTDDLYDPTLTLIYLPHLDYCLQKFGPNDSKISVDLRQIDTIVEELVTFYEKKGAQVILLSEYGIAPVNNPIHLNRLFRQHGLLQVRIERGLELLDPGASKAFVVADHQIAHVYINETSVTEQVVSLLKAVPGIELILNKKEQSNFHINHERAGDLVLVAADKSWFTYYFWLDDAKAPDYARVVDIHKKPGYDPIEMFMTSKVRAGYKLLRKKVGLRYVMDVIPLDASLVKGSHGRSAVQRKYAPVLITKDKIYPVDVKSVQIFDIIWGHLNKTI